jgi:hypothetical protein
MNDFFGYHVSWNLKDHERDFRVSILEQVRLLKQPGMYFNLCLIKVSIEGYIAYHHRIIGLSIFFARKIYANLFGLGIGRIEYYFTHEYDEASPEYVGDDADVEAITEHWNAPGDGIDVFYVLAMENNIGGKSPTPGSCDKSGWDSGCCLPVHLDLEYVNWYRFMGFSLAHELGHYLGLSHESSNGDPNNLMYPKGDLYKPPNEDGSGISITADQVFLIIGDGQFFPPNCWLRAGTVP